jgi:hypothetical protein
VADRRNRVVVRPQSQVWRGYLKGVVFYLYRSRVVSSKDSQRHDKGEDSSRHAGGDVADVEDSIVRAKIRIRRRWSST